MKKKGVAIFIVALLSIVSLAGLVVCQYTWVNRAIALASSQHNQKVIAALNAVSTEYEELYSGTFPIKDSLALPAEEYLNRGVLDSLLSAHLANNGLPQKYEHYIVNVANSDSIYRSSKPEGKYYSIPLSQLLGSDSVNGLDNQQFRIRFLGDKHYILGETWQWLIVYTIFITIIIASLVYLIRTVLRQNRNSKEQADFIHSMIHELKTPVATIGMSSKVLKKAGISITDFEKLRNYAEIVDQENNRIWACVDSLLQMLTVNKRSLNLKKELIDVNSIVKAAVDSFSIATMAHPVTFNLSLDDELPSILADKMHVRAVIDNIVDNAIKYSPVNSSISIRTERIRKNIIIIVKDNGKGIAKKDQKKIFKKFYRVASEKKKGIKGFGLGLYYIKQVVNAHDGKVFIKSKLNKGTYIGVLLPKE